MGADGSASRPPSGAAGTSGEPAGCPESAHDVTLYVDGELGEAERSAMEGHLEHCTACRSAVRYEQAFLRAVREKAAPAAAVRAPEKLRARLTLALDAAPPPATPLAQPPAAAPRRWMRPMPVAAAGATALGLTAWLFMGHAADDVVHDLVARHARRLPLEFQSSDPKMLESWLSDKIDFRVHVPRIARENLSLLGARLSNVRDHSAVYLLYGNRQSPARRVSMLVYDDPSGNPPSAGIPRKVEDHEVYTANSAGYNVALWKQDEIVYSLVSDGDDDVLELVRATNR